MLPIFFLEDFEEVNPSFGKKWKGEEVRKDRVEGLHLLPSATNHTNEKESFVGEFREIYGLPFDYLKRQAQKIEPHWRPFSPLREQFSQAFGAYYARVP